MKVRSIGSLSIPIERFVRTKIITFLSLIAKIKKISDLLAPFSLRYVDIISNILI